MPKGIYIRTSNNGFKKGNIFGNRFKKGNTINIGRVKSEETKAKRRLTISENNPFWKGGRVVDSNGYILIYSPNHLYATKKYYVFEHRLVMEEAIGRYLVKEEVVHHINEIKDDNIISNLMLFANNAEHIIYHKVLKKDKKYSTCVQLEINKC